MGKRGPASSGDRRRKKYKVATGIIDPAVAGVYATCPRNKEKQCIDELMNLFSEKLEEYGIKPLEKVEELLNGSKPEGEGDTKELSIEDSIKAELEGLGKSKSGDHKLLKPIFLGQECLVFIKFKKPIDPEQFIHRIMTDLYNSKTKQTRLVLKLVPVQSSCNASIEELTKLAKKVLKRHFHEEGNPHYKFAINVSRRNFNTIPKETLINKVAECMGHEYGHKVDLKEFDKLIMVECFKNNIGLSVVDDYNKFSRYNVDAMFAKKKVDLSNSRVGDSAEVNKNESTKDSKEDMKSVGTKDADSKEKENKKIENHDKIIENNDKKIEKDIKDTKNDKQEKEKNVETVSTKEEHLESNTESSEIEEKNQGAAESTGIQLFG